MAEPAASKSVWRFATATRAHVVVDAADYFELVRQAMLNAQCRIMLIGWDFDTRIAIGRKRRKKGHPPNRLGDFLVWLADRSPELDIRILKWNFGALKALGRGATIFDMARWALHRKIEFKFDSAHPFGCSHHQKIVVIDDLFAVCGGIDMTSDRWDTPEHRDDDPRRKRPNRTLYGPWHDATMFVEGEAAAALAELGRERWEMAGGGKMEPCEPREGTPWPEQLDAEYRDVEIGIARTRAAHNGCEPHSEIEALFLEQIARARRFIYAENQYLTSRKIGEAIALRMGEPDPPEIVIVGPETADGWLEQKAMDGARVQLIRAIGEKDRHGRFSVFVPYTEGGAPIYVHAKLMIVDDEIVRVGSANMNNRSLGLDSECDLFIDAARSRNRSVAREIADLRVALLAEHCGVSVLEMAALLKREGSMHGAIAASGTRRLRRLELPELSDAEAALAEKEALDPEKPEDLFEPFASPGLFRRSRILRAPS
jgi:phosphatidylserine/phosphatidylglycerophosphate/cardiolipin synthase-like enzyme